MAVTKNIVVIDSVSTGSLVREKRKAAGMTLKQLSELSGIHWTVLSDMENGRRDWNEEKFGLVKQAIEGGVGG